MTQVRIINIDDKCLSAEDTAMLQALYSRSSESVLYHLEKHKHVKSGEFMEKYYVNYGHASIADCGNTTFFIEGVSILAAKEIQNNPLYRGQETSSRYIDFAKSGFYTPGNEKVIRDIQEKLIDIYEYVKDAIKSQYIHKAETEQEKRSVDAYAFDVARGFLPAGVKTQLSWTTDLRKLRENISRFIASDIDEVVNIGYKLLEEAERLFPSTMKDITPKKRVPCDVTDIGYSSATFRHERPSINDTFRENGLYDVFELENIDEIVGPKEMLGYCQILGKIDYGSWRDIQRHRRGYIHFVYPDVALATNYMDITEILEDSFYIKVLPDNIKDKVYAEMLSIYGSISSLGSIYNNNQLMYVTPMMTPVPFIAQWDYPQLEYVLKLRSQPTVHPTLRELIRDIQYYIDDRYGIWIGDNSDIVYGPVLKRGNQTIKEKLND